MASSRMSAVNAAYVSRTSRATERRLKAKGDSAISLVVDPDPRQWAKSLAGLRKGFDDFRPALIPIATVIARGHAANINSHGALLNAKWPKPSPEYTLAKRKRGFGTASLILTHRLWTEATRIGGRSIVALTNKKVSVGVRDVPYARAVQFKHKYSFVGWNSQMRTAAQQILDAYVDGQIERAMAEAAK